MDHGYDLANYIGQTKHQSKTNRSTKLPQKTELQRRSNDKEKMISEDIAVEAQKAAERNVWHLDKIDKIRKPFWNVLYNSSW